MDTRELGLPAAPAARNNFWLGAFLDRAVAHLGLLEGDSLAFVYALLRYSRIVPSQLRTLILDKLSCFDIPELGPVHLAFARAFAELETGRNGALVRAERATAVCLLQASGKCSAAADALSFIADLPSIAQEQGLSRKLTQIKNK